MASCHARNLEYFHANFSTHMRKTVGCMSVVGECDVTILTFLYSMLVKFTTLPLLPGEEE